MALTEEHSEVEQNILERLKRGFFNPIDYYKLSKAKLWKIRYFAAKAAKIEIVVEMALVEKNINVIETLEKMF